MTLGEKIKFWERKAKGHYQLVQEHYRLKNYLWCLFLCHLCLEKALKARVLEMTKHEAPYTHDLVILARLAKITTSKEQSRELETFTNFNIEARYEDYKETLKKTANKNYTKQYLDLTKEYLTWFLNRKSTQVRLKK